MTFTAILASMLLAQPPTEPRTWRCLQYHQSGETELIVTRDLDDAGRPLGDHVLWLPHPNGGDSAIRWVRRGATAPTTLPWTLQTVSLRARLSLARAAQRPVWAVLRVDGRIVGRRQLLRQMSELSAYDREHLAVTAFFGADGPKHGPVPDLAHAAEILITAEEEGGEILATDTIPMPSADLVAGIIAQLAPLLDQDAFAYRTRCRDTSQPLPVPPMPPRPQPSS